MVQQSILPGLVGDRRIACFGELIIRLTPPGRELLGRARSLEVHPGGAEANVAIALAGLGYRTRMISRVPDDALGDMATQALRLAGVDIDHVGRGGGRMAFYYMAAGAGVRASEIVYDRTATAFAGLRWEDLDWDAALDGVGLLHMSGITAALGTGPAMLAVEVVRAARDRGVAISFDCNHRASLWAARTDDPRPTLRALMDHATIIFGDHRDLSLVLDRTVAGDTESARRAAAELAFQTFPKLRILAATRRMVRHVDRQSLGARIDAREGGVETDPIELSGIVERIGGGDAFAAGTLHGILAEAPLARTADIALSLAALKHTIPGDAATFSRRDLANFMAGGGDVRR